MKSLLTSMLLAAVTSGCALTSKADMIDIRYFTPDAPAIERSTAFAGRGPELRLGRVAAGDALHERIAYSDGIHEVGYYDDRRWTERPDLYVRRALGQALYERHGLRHVVGGEAPTLDVDVLAFEEIKTKTKHAVRIDLQIQLADERSVLFEARRTVERPVPPVQDAKTFAPVPAAMAAALAEVTEEVAVAVVATLQKRAESAPTASAVGAR